MLQVSNKRNPSTPAGHARKTLLLAALLVAALAMTGCYMEPDRVVDDTNGLAVATNGQQFQTVITPTPVVTVLDVTADAAWLCFKSANAVILRGGKDSIESNRAIARVLPRRRNRVPASSRS